MDVSDRRKYRAICKLLTDLESRNKEIGLLFSVCSLGLNNQKQTPKKRLNHFYTRVNDLSWPRTFETRAHLGPGADPLMWHSQRAVYLLYLNGGQTKSSGTISGTPGKYRYVAGRFERRKFMSTLNVDAVP